MTTRHKETKLKPFSNEPSPFKPTKQRQKTTRPSFAPAFHFEIEIGGIAQAYVTSVQGLEAEIETETYREGGLNDFEHKFYKGTKYPPLVLKKGMTTSHLLWEWFSECSQGIITRKNCTIRLLNMNDYDKVFEEWTFLGCFPVKWTGPELTADKSAVAIETLEFVYQGFYVES